MPTDESQKIRSAFIASALTTCAVFAAAAFGLVHFAPPMASPEIPSFLVGASFAQSCFSVFGHHGISTSDPESEILAPTLKQAKESAASAPRPTSLRAARLAGLRHGLASSGYAFIVTPLSAGTIPLLTALCLAGKTLFQGARKLRSSAQSPPPEDISKKKEPRARRRPHHQARRLEALNAPLRPRTDREKAELHDVRALARKQTLDGETPDKPALG